MTGVPDHRVAAHRIRQRLYGNDKLDLLDPSRHLTELWEADVLRRILQKDKFSSRLAAIRTGWAGARAHKRRFQLFGRVSILFRVVAIVAGASFVLPISWISNPDVKTIIMAVQFACLAISWLALEIVDWTSAAKNWIEARRELMVAEAEFYDEFFRDTEVGHENEPTPLLVKLEFFLFFALVVPNQYFGLTIAMYKGELARERRKLMLYRLVTLVAIAVSIYCFLQVLGVVPAFFSTEAQSWAVFVGVIAAALGGASATRSAMDLQSETIDRFSRTSQALQDAEDRIDTVRTYAANDQFWPVYRFVQLVLAVRSEEQSEWIATRTLSRPFDALGLQQDMVTVGRS